MPALEAKSSAPIHRATIWHALAAFVLVRMAGLVALWVMAAIRHKSAHSVFFRWDAQWYRRIAENGYGYVTTSANGHRLSDYAFFPAQPIAERTIHFLTNLSAVSAGLVVAAVASVFAATGIYRIASHVYDARVAFFAVFLWASIPIGVVESLSYSESLFTAFAAWSLFFLLKRKWLLAATFSSLASFTRPIGLAVALAVIVTIFSIARRQRERISREQLLAIALAPLGWIAYVIYVGVKTRSITGYFGVESRWGNGFDGGRAFLRWCAHLLTGPTPLAGVAVVLAVALLMWLLVTCYRQEQPLPLLVYILVLVALSLTTSGYFGSKPRYLLPGFPLLFPLARYLERQKTKGKVVISVGLIMAGAGYGAFWLLGNGPL